MKKNMFYFKKILLYFSVIITSIILVASLLSYNIVHNRVLENEKSYQESALHYFQNTVQIIFKNASDMAFTQINLRKNENIFSDEFLKNSIKKLKVLNDLTSSYVDTSGIYDVILTDYEKYVYAANSGCSNYDGSPYREALNEINNSNSEWQYSKIYDYKYYNYGNPGKVNVIMRSIKSGKNKLYCVVIINIKTLNDILKMYSTNDYSYYIANNDVIVPVSAKNHEDADTEIIAECIASRTESMDGSGIDSSIVDLIGSKYHICTLSTQGIEWKYISMISLDDLNKSAVKIRRTGFIFGTAGLFVSLILLLFVSLKLYKPIQYIVQKISLHFNDVPQKSDMLYIDNALDKLIISNENAVNALKNNKGMIRDSIINKILLGDENFDKTILGEYSYYSVGIINLKSGNRHIKDLSIHIDKIFGQAVHYDKVETMDGVVILFKLDDPNQEFIDINRNVALLNDYLTENMDVQYVIGTGKLVKNSCEIKDSYRQALECCRFRLVKGWNTVIRYDDINISETTCPSEIMKINEKTVIDLLSAGATDKALEYFEGLLLEYGRNHCFNERIMYSVYFEIISFLLKHMDENGIYADTKYNIPSIMNVETINEMKTNIKNIITYISANLNTNMNQIVKAAGDYIMEHYNEDISLTLLGEKLYLSESYLSRIFKKYFGVNFNEYLIEIRMKKAYEILKSSNHSILRVAELVGYNNISSFNKAFKKYSGCTPGGYRRMNCNISMETAIQTKK